MSASSDFIYNGPALQVLDISSIAKPLGGQGLYWELRFDLKGDSVNKFNAVTVADLGKALDAIEKHPQFSSIKGILITSGKDVFIVGADITEFVSHFEKSESEISSWLQVNQKQFSRIEDLPFPTVVSINGFALGGGYELALSATYRAAGTKAKVGLPETKLGIIPGWGGTVRLPRLIGADNALEWIASGQQWSSSDALKVGAVDAVFSETDLAKGSLTMLIRASQGGLPWKEKTAEKQGSLKLNRTEATMVFQGAKAFVMGQAGPNYPAPLAAVEVVEKGATLSRNAAMDLEAQTFARVAKTPAARALVQIFLGDQYVKKEAKRWSKSAGENAQVKKAAVLGAGIMGGGIAYQSATNKVAIAMKDIRPEALLLGMGEAAKLLDKRVSKKQMSPLQMAEVLGRIQPTLQDQDLKDADLIVEAVVENEGIKKTVLQNTESLLSAGAVLCSNTSTILISKLAEGLKRPELFCGMHFFNPVPRMPLVEIIRGKKTSDGTIGRAVAYALTLGKSPVVVQDCPGFLVNRVLFTYFGGFMMLLKDGVDFQRIDKVMEKFGWPMGPAYLLDVVGVDTAVHASQVMAAGFPDRMKYSFKTAIETLFEAKRLGQKNGKGFYLYTTDPKGKPKKEADPTVYDLLGLKPLGGADVSDQEIVDRMMLPFLFESSRCLDEGIVASPLELDMAMVYGLGFPPFRGGPCLYADTVGAKTLVEKAKTFARLGALYQADPLSTKMAEATGSASRFHKAL